MRNSRLGRFACLAEPYILARFWSEAACQSAILSQPFAKRANENASISNLSVVLQREDELALHVAQNKKKRRLLSGFLRVLFCENKKLKSSSCQRMGEILFNASLFQS
jgi:hypothetical protein